MTANHARELAQRVGLARPEEAYVWGMFRNFGEVMTASCLEEDYAAIVREITEHKRSQRDACLRVLGFDYQDLGQAMARRWSMPPQIDRVIRASDMPKDLGDRIAVFSEALTNAVYRRDARLAPSSAKAVMQKYGGSLGLSDEDVRAVLETAVTETSETFRAMRVALDDLRLRHRIGAALALDPAAAVGPTVSCPGALGTPVPGITSELGGQMAAEVEAALASPTGFDLHRVLLMTIEAALRGGGFDRVVFALVTANRQEVLGRLGLGRDAESLVERFWFAVGTKGGAVGVALSRQQELVLSRGWELRPEESATLKTLGASMLVVLPVVLKGVLVGCMYFDRVASTTAPEGTTLTLVRRFVAAAQAMAPRRRSGDSKPRPGRRQCAAADRSADFRISVIPGR